MAYLMMKLSLARAFFATPLFSKGKRLILLIACLGFVSTHLKGQALSNRDLLACCQSASVERKAICTAVLENTAQGLLFYRNLFDQKDVYLNVCFPETLNIGDLVQIYITWIQERPELLEGAAFLGATSAISTSYSCKKNQSDK